MEVIMNDFTILPLNPSTALVYLKHMLTLASWCAIVALGVMIYWRSRQPWWTLFSAAYAIRISRIAIDGIRTKLWPLPLQLGGLPEEPLIQYEEIEGPAISAAPKMVEQAEIVIVQSGFWDLTAVFIAIGMIWAYRSCHNRKAVYE